MATTREGGVFWFRWRWRFCVMAIAVAAALATPVLFHSRPERVVRDLMAELKARDANTRANAALKLRRFGTKAAPAIPLLIELLGDGTTGTISGNEGGVALSGAPTTVGGVAAVTLGAIGPTAVPALIDVLRKGSPFARKYANEALIRISGEVLPPDADKWEAWFAKEGKAAQKK